MALTRHRWAERDTVPAAALAEDVRDLRVAMGRLYAGFPELLQDPRFDVDRFFGSWEERLRSAGPAVSFDDGVLRPFVDLRRAHRDNHLDVDGWGWRVHERPELTVSEYQTSHPLTEAALRACSFGDVEPIPATLRLAPSIDASRTTTIATFSAQSAADAIDGHCGAEVVRFERRRLAAEPAHDETDPPYQWRVVGDASVIVVRRLYGPPKDVERLRALAKDYAEHRKHGTIVFDFRGNGGGDDEYVYAWIDAATNRAWQNPYVEVQITGALYPCGRWNSVVDEQIRDGRVDNPDAKAERAAILREDARHRPIEQIDASPVESRSKAPYHGRIFVLVDRYAGSSGESGPDALHAALGATLVGERTAGYMEYGNVVPWLMPRTGIRWDFATKRNYYPSPREGVGLPVDVYLAPSLLEQPIDALVPILEKRLSRAAPARRASGATSSR